MHAGQGALSFAPTAQPEKAYAALEAKFYCGLLRRKRGGFETCPYLRAREHQAIEAASERQGDWRCHPFTSPGKPSVKGFWGREPNAAKPFPLGHRARIRGDGVGSRPSPRLAPIPAAQAGPKHMGLAFLASFSGLFFALLSFSSFALSHSGLWRGLWEVGGSPPACAAGRRRCDELCWRCGW